MFICFSATVDTPARILATLKRNSRPSRIHEENRQFFSLPFWANSGKLTFFSWVAVRAAIP
jgi:hypothetical protein